MTKLLRMLQPVVYTVVAAACILATAKTCAAGPHDIFEKERARASSFEYNLEESSSLNKRLDAFLSLLEKFPKHPKSNVLRWEAFRLSLIPGVDDKKALELPPKLIAEIVNRSDLSTMEGREAAIQFAWYHANYHSESDERKKSLLKAEGLMVSLMQAAIAENDLALEIHARSRLGRVLDARKLQPASVKALLDLVVVSEKWTAIVRAKTLKDNRYGDVGVELSNARTLAARILEDTNDPRVAEVVRDFLKQHPSLELNEALETNLYKFDAREEKRLAAPKDAAKSSAKMKQRIEFAKRHPLRADPKLRAKLSIVHSDPEMTYLLARLADATTLHFTMSDSLVHHAPKNGEFLLKDVFAYSVMEVIAERDLTDGRWVKTDDGYRLEGESRALRVPPPVWPWVAATVALLVVASAGFVWRKRRARTAASLAK